MGVGALYKVQAGRETTWGTSVAATAFMYPTNLSGFRDPNPFIQPTERRGSFAPARRAYQAKQGAEGSIEMDATFEDVLFLLEMSLKTGALTGAGPYVYTYTPSTTAANTPKSYTVEYGDDVQEYEVGGVLAKSLTISAAVDEVVKLKADLFGKSVTASTFTGSLTHRTVEPILANKCTIFLDDTGGTIGTGANLKSDGTSVANSSLIGWEWRLPEHFYPVYYQAGALTPTTYGEKMFQPELDVTVAFKSVAATMRTKWAAGTRQLVRISAAGSGTSAFKIDGAFTILDDPLILDERDGETTIQLKMKAEYDQTDALYCTIVVTNSMSAHV